LPQKCRFPFRRVVLYKTNTLERFLPRFSIPDDEIQTFFKTMPTEAEAALTMIRSFKERDITDVLYYCGVEHLQLPRIREGLGEGLSEEDYDIKLLDLGKVLKVRCMLSTNSDLVKL
jgi:hypothetical protein